MEIKKVKQYIEDNYKLKFEYGKVINKYLYYKKSNKCYELHFYTSLIGRNEIMYYVWNQSEKPLIMGYQYYVPSNFYEELDYILTTRFNFTKYGKQLDLF